jgi:hypothetical protein
MPLDPKQTLGKIVPEANNFQNIMGFLENGGQRGPQRGIIREGTYAINLAQFIVVTATDIKAIFNAGSKQERGELAVMQQTLTPATLPAPLSSWVRQPTSTDGYRTVHDGLPLPRRDYRSLRR